MPRLPRPVFVCNSISVLTFLWIIKCPFYNCSFASIRWPWEVKCRATWETLANRKSTSKAHKTKNMLHWHTLKKRRGFIGVVGEKNTVSFSACLSTIHSCCVVLLICEVLFLSLLSSSFSFHCGLYAFAVCFAVMWCFLWLHRIRPLRAVYYCNIPFLFLFKKTLVSYQGFEKKLWKINIVLKYRTI